MQIKLLLVKCQKSFFNQSIKNVKEEINNHKNKFKQNKLRIRKIILIQKKIIIIIIKMQLMMESQITSQRSSRITMIMLKINPLINYNNKWVNLSKVGSNKMMKCLLILRDTICILLQDLMEFLPAAPFTQNY